MSFFKYFIMLLLCFAMFSCSCKRGELSVISSQKVKGLKYKRFSRNHVTKVQAESCGHRIYLTRTILGIPLIFPWFKPSLDLTFGEDADDLMSGAVSKALKKAKNSGEVKADMIVNAKISEVNFTIPLLYGYNCVSISGDGVSSYQRNRRSSKTSKN